MNSNDTYSLVTCTCDETPEAGSQITPNQPDGVIKGVLARGRRGNWYQPVASSGAIANLDFYRIIASAPEPFPHPAPGNIEEQNAYNYIGERLCGRCNFRATYSNKNFTISLLISHLKDLKDPAPGVDCDRDSGQTAFCTVRAQLLSELNYADFVRNLSGNVGDLWNSNQGNVSLTLNSVYNEIDASLNRMLWQSPAPLAL